MAKKKLGLAEQYEVFLANAVEFPGLLEQLRVTLGDSLSIDAIMDLGVGFHPQKRAWVFPERDPKGGIRSFTYRDVETGGKLCVTGGKRGLTYVYNPHYARDTGSFKAGAHNWTRTTSSLRCPVCDKAKFCMVERDNPTDPSVVLCTKVGKGAKRATSNGWIHEMKPGGDKCGVTSTVLPDTDLPILGVEGGSDVIAGQTLGFVTIGRPSNTGGIHDLRQMPLGGKTLIMIGENDKQVNKLGKEIFPGYDGVKKACVEMRDITTVKMIMPPEGHKDLRGWLKAGLTQEELLEYIDKNAVTMADLPDTVFETDDPAHIADKFLDERYTEEGVLTLREYNGLFLGWDGSHYKELHKNVLRGGIYSFLDGKSAVITGANQDPKVVPIKSSARRVSDVIDAFSKRCPASHGMPVWLDGRGAEMPAVDSVIAFKNGILNVDEYCKGNLVMYKPDPRYFSTCALPYDFDDSVESSLAMEFFDDVFESDKERMRLMQQWFGYNLVPDTHLQKFMLMHGIPRSGKSTIVEMIQHMVGIDQCCSIRFENLASEFGRQTMLGKQCCFIGDTRSPGKSIAGIAMEQMLRIIGEDTVGVNRKRIDELPSVLLKIRFTFAMNELPFFIDSSNAMAARMLILDFNKSYSGREDYTLRGRLRNEAKRGALMNYALRGLKDLREQGRFEEPTAARETMDDFVEMASPVATFINECCEYDEGARVSKDKLFDVWSIWAENAGYNAGVKVHFGRKLRSAGVGRIQIGKLPTKEHAYTGIKLNEMALNKYDGGE